MPFFHKNSDPIRDHMQGFIEVQRDLSRAEIENNTLHCQKNWLLREIFSFAPGNINCLDLLEKYVNRFSLSGQRDKEAEEYLNAIKKEAQRG